MIRKNFSFPVICFHHIFLRIRHDFEGLTTTTKAGLKNGLFRNLLIVDCDGHGFRVKDATKLHGVGLFWGYNIFLNQRIKVELIFEYKPFKVTIDEVKERVSNSLKKWHGWSTRDDFDELQEAIKNSQSISEIIQILDQSGKT